MTIRIIFFEILFFAVLTTSCENKPANAVRKSDIIVTDRLRSMTKKLVDFCFIETSIAEMNQINNIQANDSNEISRKFYAIEHYMIEGKNKNAKELLQGIVAIKSLDSRTLALAWKELNNLGEYPRTLEVLGVILEIPSLGETNYFATYSDSTVRYVNIRYNPIALQVTDKQVGKIIEEIKVKAQRFIEKGGLEKGRVKVPTSNIRFNFLTTGGLFHTEIPGDSIKDQTSLLSDIYHSSAEIIRLIGGEQN